MDVAVKGLFWLLEACRESPVFRQVIRVGGDAGIGTFFSPRPAPGTADPPHQASPGCYRPPTGRAAGTSVELANG